MIENRDWRALYCHGCRKLQGFAGDRESAFLAPQRVFCWLCGNNPSINKKDTVYLFRRRLQSWLANGGRFIAAAVVADAARKFLRVAVEEEARRRIAWADWWKTAVFLREKKRRVSA